MLSRPASPEVPGGGTSQLRKRGAMAAVVSSQSKHDSPAKKVKVQQHGSSSEEYETPLNSSNGVLGSYEHKNSNNGNGKIEGAVINNEDGQKNPVEAKSPTNQITEFHSVADDFKPTSVDDNFAAANANDDENTDSEISSQGSVDSEIYYSSIGTFPPDDDSETEEEVPSSQMLTKSPPRTLIEPFNKIPVVTDTSVSFESTKSVETFNEAQRTLHSLRLVQNEENIENRQIQDNVDEALVDSNNNREERQQDNKVADVVRLLPSLPDPWSEIEQLNLKNDFEELAHLQKYVNVASMDSNSHADPLPKGTALSVDKEGNISNEQHQDVASANTNAAALADPSDDEEEGNDEGPQEEPVRSANTAALADSSDDDNDYQEPHDADDNDDDDDEEEEEEEPHEDENAPAHFANAPALADRDNDGNGDGSEGPQENGNVQPHEAEDLHEAARALYQTVFSPSDADLSSIDALAEDDKDIECGPQAARSDRQANRDFRRILEARIPEYREIVRVHGNGPVRQKRQLIQATVDYLIVQGYRFARPYGDKRFYLATHSWVKYKVSQFFRDH